jgi:electron-transferring-flavoprotein dehydrogenase
MLQELFDGGLRNRVPSHPGYENLQPVAKLPADGGPEAHLLGPAKGDGKLTFDKLTDLYHSGTKHEEDQPAHLLIQDTNICNDRCLKEFGSPCQNFCPANVYEMLDDPAAPNGKRISLNPPTASTAKPATFRTPIRSSPGCHRKAAAAQLRRNVSARNSQK